MLTESSVCLEVCRCTIAMAEGSFSEVGFIRQMNDFLQTQDVAKEEISLDSCEQMAKDKLHRSPESMESDLESDLEVDRDSVQEPNDSIKTIYVKACQKLMVIPCSPFLRKLRSDEIDISHYNIGSSGAKAIAEAMNANTWTSLLNVSDNGVGSEGATSLALMLCNNCFITVLDLSTNFIGRDGAAAIFSMLETNKYLLELNLASNRLGDASVALLSHALRKNNTLRVLNLSSNEIGVSDHNMLSAAIAENTGLLYIDLSCNHIRNSCAKGVLDALKVNATIKYVNLSDNGFADNVSSSLKSMLKANSKLRELNLSRNRLTAAAAKDIAVGLEKNKALKVLRISSNPIQSYGATIILKGLVVAENSCLEELHMNEVNVSSDFERELSELFQKSSYLYVEYGTIFFGGENRHRTEIQKDLVSRILDFIEFRGMRLVDFFRSVDKTDRLTITKAEFKRGLKSAGIPVRSQQVDQLFKLLDTEGTGCLQYKDFVTLTKKDFDATFKKSRRNYQWNH